MLRIAKGGRLLYKSLERKRWYDVTENLIGFFTDNPHNFCNIDDGVTFLDIFKLLKKHENILCKILHPELSNFLKEIRKKTTEEYNNGDYLEIYWYSLIDKDHELCDDCSFHLVRNIKNPTGDFEEDFPFLSITYTPLNEIKNYPIKLNKKYEIYNEKNEKLISVKKDFKLINIISAIIWEITWFGGPENRNKSFNELKIGD